jgi:putative ABC transport system permease protein
MSIPAAVLLAWRAIWRARGRSVAMMLGTLIGLCALTVLNSIGEGTRRETMARVKNMLGTFDTVLIRPGAGQMRGMISVTNAPPNIRFTDAAAIAQLPEIRQVAQLQNAFDVDIKYRDQTSQAAVFGVSANWLDLRGDAIAEGDFFTGAEEQNAARVAVLGSDARKELFGDAAPIGKTIEIGATPFRVTGILLPRGAGPSSVSLDNLILIPVTTASKRLFNRDFVTMVIAQLRNPEQSRQVIADIRSLLRSRHHLPPSAMDDFTITDPHAVFERLANVATAFTRILWGIAIGAMILGGAVVTTLMSMSVAGRQREIGIRRSIGASRLHVLAQFLLEAVWVTTLGGLLGIAIGAVLIRFAASLQHLQVVFLSRDLLLSVLLAVTTGLAFGLYPAVRAARTDPIEALRA